MANDIGKGIYRGYQSAGQDFLAYRLAKLFVRIESEADVALHNDVVSEVLQIVYGEEKGFFRDLAGIVLYKDKYKVELRKRFLFRVAGQILNIGQKKG
jgi:hypothetical protein